MVLWWRRCVVLLAVGLLGSGWATRPARALEAWDGRIQIHGFAEEQVRAISEDYNDALDLTQWYNVLNVEVEAALLQEPIGPLDMVSAYVRGEVRYDCVWTRACGVFPSANTYGDRARKLPRKRLSDGRYDDTTGEVLLGNSHFASRDSKPETAAVVTPFRVLSTINPASFDYIFERTLDFRFTELHSRSGLNFNHAARTLGPWLPRNFINANATLADRANPFDNSVVYPPSGNLGNAALPFRPIPVADPGAVFAAAGPARGVYIPSAADLRAVQDGEVQDISHYFNFRQAERAWNHGKSQQQTQELKEAYLELEMFDSQLWIRLGRQSIVWGKTELFRTTDQFNPEDLALASLPSLEESRIPLWSGRFIWSLWNTPLPVQDLRLEFAFNFDRFQGADLGACGEPYTPNPVCDATFGIYAHGITGLGIVGVDEPPPPWKDIKGLELGGRVEFRWNRFSVAFMDFWGYDDMPHLRRVTTYERNVDPATGVPRVMGARGPCQMALVGLSYQRVGNDCLQPGPTFRGAGTPLNIPLAGGGSVSYGAAQAAVPNNALVAHPADLQNFTFICSTTVGFVPNLDPAACAQNVFGSPAVQAGVIPLGSLISGVLAGFPGANGLYSSVAGQNIVGLPVVALTDDDALRGGPGAAREVVPGAALGSPEGGSNFLNLFGPVGAGGGLSGRLTPEQEALLGCGPFWGTNCDDNGIDLLNAEASALLQSFVGFDGSGPSNTYVIPMGTGGAPVGPPQPGHVGFVGGPVCTTGDIRNDGRNDVLPGCRGPGQAGYAQNVDGSVTAIGYIPAGPLATDGYLPYQGPGAQNPLHGQTFASEMAAVSWNFMMFVVTASGNFQGQNTGNPAADLARAFSTQPGVCSFRQPQWCDVMDDLWTVAGVKRNTIAAGGTYAFGRRTWQWQTGGDAVFAYQKRNVLGLSLDFAEDTTKSNWSLEFTWIEGEPFDNSNRVDGLSYSDTYNLTISADRPTFVNFLNANRTFFFNSQWFFQYIPDFKQGFTTTGPWNVLFTFSVQTGYLQDRLLPDFTVVWDVKSQSGAFLPEIQYLFTANFSATIGLAIFNGREQLRDMPLAPLGGSDNFVGQNAYKVGVENGLAAVRDRDEIFFRLRYTF